MQTTSTFTATDFKARCLEIFDQLAARKLSRVTVTKRGKVVAVLIPPDVPDASNQLVHGFMRGSVVIPPELDLTEPVLDEEFSADRGVLHE